ncbi:MAG: N-6 DNA methylase [Bacteroidales bacterium]|jgi:type I restriction-modification system DNA methylase subunit|nr:N-6 DNA methylase [Bacteroidales bacterium]
MNLFQQSILDKHITANADKISEAYKLYASYFHNVAIQENIRNSKEEQFQEGFLRELFVKILGYTLNPDPDYNLITEQKNETDSRKADGAILVGGEVAGIIELKDRRTTDLKQVEAQAFGYKNYHRKASYVVISNFEKLRFYIDNAIDFVEFNLFTLTADEFALLWLCLAHENIARDLPKQLKSESTNCEDLITKQLYKEYAAFKRALFTDMRNLNKGINPLALFKKSQKLLDRLLFILFAEDCGLLPPNSITEIIKQWEMLKELDEYKPLYDRFKKYFGYMNTGHKGKKHDIFAYNGGLFKPDEVLDTITISDEVLRKHCLKLADYNFKSEVDVNILGHIFENSLTEIEEVSADLTRGFIPLSENNKGLKPLATKRKKDGVFYTPRYITTYIVENTVGKLCADKKAELEIDESEYFADKKRQLSVKKKLAEKLENYRQWLLGLTICDPACGSGAFLNAALDFLMAEHRLIDEMQTKLLGGGFVFPNIENAILENNLYGVDINEESVEIAKLALWLRTAKPNRKLNSLNNNIKCGNSLISPNTADMTRGLIPLLEENAFDWHKEFPKVFTEKHKTAFHVTTAIHDSRTSQRMIDYKVREMRAKCDKGINPLAYADPRLMDDEDELIITQTIAQIVKEDNLNVLAYNICRDHLHLLIVCEVEELDTIVGKIKSKTARACNIARGVTVPAHITRGHAPLSNTTVASSGNKGACPLATSTHKQRGETQMPFWTQKFGYKEITDQEQLFNTIEYIENNRIKHELPTNKGLQPLVNTMLCTIDHAFRPEYKGGFDVVIGNPPYGAKIDKEQINYLSEKYKHWGISTALNDTYFVFYAFALEIILKTNGYLGFITPNTWKLIDNAKTFRKTLFADFEICQIIQHLNKVFEDATVDCDTLIIRKSKGACPLVNPDVRIQFLNASVKINEHFVSQQKLSEQDYINLFLTQKDYDLKTKIAEQSVFVKDELIIKNGVKPYEKGKGKPAQTDITMREKPFTSETKQDDSFSPLIGGSYFHKYRLLWNNDYWIQYGEWLAAPRDKEIFDAKEKLIFRQTSDSIIGTLIGSGFIIRNNAHIVLNMENPCFDLKYVLALLNSKLVNWYYWTINPEKGEAMAEVKAFHLGLLPVKKIPVLEQQPFIDLADKMLSLNAELQSKQTKFSRRLADNLGCNKGINPLVITTFAQFLAELKKPGKGLKPIALSLKQQDEWEEYFNEYKTDCNKLSAEISATDKEIDALVYALYGLTEEEIKIIENK